MTRADEYRPKEFAKILSGHNNTPPNWLTTSMQVGSNQGPVRIPAGVRSPECRTFGQSRDEQFSAAA